MILQIDDWTFDIDMTATMEYSAAEAADHCTCADCRNFYACVDQVYPQLRPFLAQFGIDIFAPDRMSPIDYSTERIDYDPMYYVFGRILKAGNFEMSAGLANIVADPIEGGIDGKNCFALNVYEVSLPWTLPEPFEGSIPEKPSWWKKFIE